MIWKHPSSNDVNNFPNDLCKFIVITTQVQPRWLCRHVIVAFKLIGQVGGSKIP